MKSITKPLYAVLAIVSLCGCTTKPVHVKPPDFTRAEQSHAKAQEAVASASVHARKVRDSNDVTRGSVGRAKQAGDYDSTALAALKTKADTLFTNAPPELRPEVDALRTDIAAAQRHVAEETLPAIADALKSAETTNAAVSIVETDLAAANARLDDLGKQILTLKADDATVVNAANRNATLAGEAQKLAAKRGNLIGWAGAAVAGFGAVMLMRFAPFPYSLALPAVAAPAGYFLSRLLV